MENLIFIALSTFAVEDKRPLELLKASGYPFKIHNSGKRITGDELLQDGPDASVIVAGVESYNETVLNQLTSLRCISRCGVGVDAIDLELAKAKNITVANTPLVPVQGVAELALTMMLSLGRNLVQQTNLMAQKKWVKLPSHLLCGRTVGIIGFGRIGQKVASLCNAFGAKVLVHDVYTNDQLANDLNVKYVSKEALLSESDIVSLHASKTGSDRAIIGGEELSMMKAGSILINLARGEMVDEAELIKALQIGKLAGVGLDVYGKEPYEGPLCEFDQVILTPHTATLAFETRSEMEMQCVQNAIDFLNGTLHPDRRVI